MSMKEMQRIFYVDDIHGKDDATGLSTEQALSLIHI